MVARLNIPAAVAAVRYASGARIHRVKVSPAARPPKREASQVIILSRKILEAVRQQASGPRKLDRPPLADRESLFGSDAVRMLRCDSA